MNKFFRFCVSAAVAYGIVLVLSLSAAWSSAAVGPRDGCNPSAPGGSFGVNLRRGSADWWLNGNWAIACDPFGCEGCEFSIMGTIQALAADCETWIDVDRGLVMGDMGIDCNTEDVFILNNNLGEHPPGECYRIELLIYGCNSDDVTNDTPAIAAPIYCYYGSCTACSE